MGLCHRLSVEVKDFKCIKHTDIRTRTRSRARLSDGADTMQTQQTALATRAAPQEGKADEKVGEKILAQ